MVTRARGAQASSISWSLRTASELLGTVFEPNLGSILAEYGPVRQPSWRSRLKAALMRARWVKACGKLPKASPEGPISSA
jgi:hypothetical protein